MSTVQPVFRNELNGVDAYTRHKRLMRDYVLYYGKRADNKPRGSVKTEQDILRENHKFIRSDDDDDDVSWEQRVAKKYYDTLFKEYALCELKYYKQGKIALRWRTEREVVHGKGQFICASTRCEESQSLKSWEVNFGYVEHGEKKNELVKVRLCPDCSYRLNYKTQKRQAQRKKENKRKRMPDEEKESEERSCKRQKEDSSEEEDGQNDESGIEKRQEKEESSIWSQTVETKQEKTKEEEFEDYFADLLQ